METDVDTLYQVLSNSRRRAILRYLAEHSEQVVEVKDITDHIADTIDIERDAAYVSVYQTHLPVLEQDGFIEWDSERGVVEITDRGRTAIGIHNSVSSMLG